MEIYKKLPGSHRGNQIAGIELETSPVLSRLIKTISGVLALLMFIVGYLIFPIDALMQMEDVFVHLVALFLGMMSVFLIHELMRGVVMRILSGVKPIIRFAGTYPHAACEAYFGRSAQHLINLIPAAVTVAMPLMLLLTTQDMSWKWMTWMILTVAVCSCVGDLYVSLRIRHMPSDILILNVGPTYMIYSAEKEEEN